MHFDLSEDQKLLQQSARDFLGDHCQRPTARGAPALASPASQAIWQAITHLGWPGVSIQESSGGLALGLVDTLVLAREAGEHLLWLPLCTTMATLPALMRMGEQARHDLHECADACVRGRLLIAAQLEEGGTPELLHHANQCDEHWLIGVQPLEGGSEGWNEDGHDGGHDGVQARPGGPGGEGQRENKAETPVKVRVRVTRIPPCGAVEMQPLDPTTRIGKRRKAALDSRIEWHVARATAARALASIELAELAQMIGASSAALNLAAGHAGERQQFGKPVGSFQGVKHRLADAWVSLDNSWNACLYAAACVDDEASPFDEQAASFARVLTIEGSHAAVKAAMQAMGGLGFAWESDMHLFLKRVHAITARLPSVESAWRVLEPAD